MPVDPPPLDPSAIFAILDAHHVKYVVVGGYAAQLHGSSRPTTDIDLTTQRSTTNLQRLARALGDLEAGIRVDNLEHGLPFNTSAEALAGMKTLNLRTPYGDIDLAFEPDGTGGYPTSSNPPRTTPSAPYTSMSPPSPTSSAARPQPVDPKTSAHSPSSTNSPNSSHPTTVGPVLSEARTTVRAMPPASRPARTACRVRSEAHMHPERPRNRGGKTHSSTWPTAFSHQSASPGKRHPPPRRARLDRFGVCKCLRSRHEAEVAERLRRVAEHLTRVRVDLLGGQSESSRVAGCPVECGASPCDLALRAMACASQNVHNRNAPSGASKPSSAKYR